MYIYIYIYIYKIDKKVIKFYDNETEEYKFHQHKSPISINNKDINEIIVSNKRSIFKSSISRNIRKAFFEKI